MRCHFEEMATSRLVKKNLERIGLLCPISAQYMPTVVEDQSAFQIIVGGVLSFEDFVLYEEPDLRRLLTANATFDEFKLRAILNRARKRDQESSILNRIMIEQTDIINHSPKRMCLNGARSPTLETFSEFAKLAFGDHKIKEISATNDVYDVVLTLDEQKVMSPQVTNKSILIVELTPYLARLSEEAGLVFFNSEEHLLYEPSPIHRVITGMDYLNPDGISCPVHLYSTKDAPTNELSHLREKKGIPFLFGIGNWFLRDSYVLWVFKTRINSADFGQAYRDTNHLSRGNISTHYVILCDTTTFYIIEGREEVIISVKKGMWVTPGSKTALLEVLGFSNDSKILLNNLCTQLKVTTVPLESGSAYLGSGEHSCCFVVEDENKVRYALKTVVLYPNKKMSVVNDEFHKLTLLHDNKHVINVKENSLRIVSRRNHMCDEVGVGFLMEQVGKPLGRFSCSYDKTLLEKLFTSLSTIHASGYHHGDAHICNAVLVHDEVVWVDFTFSGRQITADLFRHQVIDDMEQLIKSIFGPYFKMDYEITQLLRQYQERVDISVASSIAAALQIRLDKDVLI